MAYQYLGEIRAFGGNFAPAGWALCDGSLLSISANESLYTLIGTTFGGDGVSTFGLPDLRGRVAMNQGTGGGGTYFMGELNGSESVALSALQLPVHTHPIEASNATATAASPSGGFFSASSEPQFSTSGASTSGTDVLATQGGSTPHENRMPSLVATYIIALQGIFPSPSGGAGETEAYIGQISAFAFEIIPQGWLACNGQSLSLSSNQALFSLLGTMYGGNGITTFLLPDLRGRFPMGMGSGNSIGTAAGEASHTLSTTELPVHVHSLAASGVSSGLQSAASGNYPASPSGVGDLYASAANTTLGTGSEGAGGSQPHTNLQPNLPISFCICTSGIFPSRS